MFKSSTPYTKESLRSTQDYLDNNSQRLIHATSDIMFLPGDMELGQATHSINTFAQFYFKKNIQANIGKMLQIWNSSRLNSRGVLFTGSSGESVVAYEEEIYDYTEEDDTCESCFE